jgi:glyoxylase-like metal-dependent hydrolase (beta-lactamase superfamily II)
MTIHNPEPSVDMRALKSLGENVWVIADNRVPLVPNIGIVLGRHSALVIDTGMGPENGSRVLAAAKKLAGDRRLFLTLTHFHPEHGFGAQAFRDEAIIVYNKTQRDELVAKGEAYLTMFRGMSPSVRAALEGVELTGPDIVYDGRSLEIDLGGRVVELRTWGMAHTRGDQTVFVRDAGALFVGDLAEESTFPIFPWFPPHDADIDASRWVEILEICEKWRPAILVPGHGEVGDSAILRDVRAYILDVQKEVAALAEAGLDDEAAVAKLRPILQAKHPDWHSPEWIDFAIRYFLAR